MVFLLFVVGLVLLVGGAELLVRGASKLALALGMTPLVIGLTVVAFGTSAPELAVAVQGAFSGNADVTVGNVVGSNIFNVLLILGLSAMVAPLIVHQQLVRLDVPVMVAVTLLTWGMAALDGKFGRVDGIVLFALGIGYTVFAIKQSKKEAAAVKREYEVALDGAAKTKPSLPTNVGLLIGGLLLLVGGAKLLVDSAVTMATWLGVSPLVIGLTIIAGGTSLPEVATSVLASFRGQRDIAVGNVVGSNLFNLMIVLGLAAAVAPNGITVAEPALRFDIPVMVAVALACLPVFFTGHKIARWEGALFFAYYVAYTAYLVLAAQRHELATHVETAMLFFALPLTAVTLLVFAAREWRSRRAPSAA